MSLAQTNGSIQHNGITRNYIVYVPATYQPGDSWPLVFVLHGFTQTASAIMGVSGFNAIADTGNFIVAYPNGVGNAWNTNSGMTGGSTADDIGFVAALTDTL
ncbi:MAG: alpha/beta hydrolase family esterase, partial [Bacteroidota bacterium]